jgi:hypothetical protein
MNWIYVVLIACAIASVCALGIAIWVVFVDNKDRQKLRAEKQALKAELDQFADEALAEQQRCEQVVSALPDLPSWIVRKVDRLKRDSGYRFQEAERFWRDASHHTKCISMSSARDQLDYAREKLALAREAVDKLVAIPGEIEQLRADADWKSIEALSRVEQAQELGKAMSDQGIVLNMAVFDALQSAAVELEAINDANGEGADDRSDEILSWAEKLLAHAEELKQMLEYLAAVRAYVPKLIVKHQHRPSDLMIRNGDAIRVLERIKSSSADHLWFDLDRQLKEVPGRIRQSRVSLALATEMSSDSSQAYLAAKQEAEAAVAILDDAELLFDEISELDVRLTAAQEKVVKTFGEVKIVVGSAVHAVEGREEVSVAAKQLALRACVAIERASYLISVSEAFDHLGAVEALGHARQFAEDALDRAKLDIGPGIDVTIWSRDHADVESEPVAEAVESMPPAGFTGEYVASPHGGAGGGTSQ